MNKQLLIAALDVSTSIMMVLVLTVISITYDANKGIGSLDYACIDKLVQCPPNVAKNRYAQEYYAVILNGKLTEILHVENDKGRSIDKFDNFADTVKEIKKLAASHSLPFVLHEEIKSPYFGDLLRLLVKDGVKTGVATEIGVSSVQLGEANEQI